MPDYRIYKLVNGGHIKEPPRLVTQPTDEDAIAQARQLLDGHDLELWQGDRLVISLKSKDKR